MDKSLKQSISAPQGVALYVGAVLGSGILILPGMTGGIAGANALISWIIMILLSIPLACTFAFLSIDYPSAGGVATFANKAFGHYTGALVGWFFFIAGSIGQIIVSLTGGTYIVFAFQLPHYVAYIIAGVLLIISVMGNYFGLKTSGKMQLGIAALTLFILLATIFLAIPSIHYKNLIWNLGPSSISPIAQCIMLIFWSFFGWEAISSLAPEFKNPRRKNILISTVGAIIIVGILYIGIAFAVIGTNSYSTGTESINEAMNHASLSEVVKKGIGTNGSWATGILAFSICLGTLNAFVASMSRLGYSLAKDNIAPFWLSKVNEKYSTPGRAVLVVGGIAGVGLLTSYIFKIGLEQLVFIPNSLGIATYIVGAAAGVKLIKHLLGKIFAMLACTLCLIAYFFVGSFLLIPILVSVCCFSYLYIKNKQTNKLAKEA
ncbi:MAG: APC family permease [Bacillota bacterium]